MPNRIAGNIYPSTCIVGTVSRGAIAGLSPTPSHASTTATPDDILEGQTVYLSDGTNLVYTEGTMPDRSSQTDYLLTTKNKLDLPSGYYSNHSVGLEETSRANLVPDNIKMGVTILGVVGTHEGTDLPEFNGATEPTTPEIDYYEGGEY